MVYFSVSSCTSSSQTEISGEMKAWHTVTLTFRGPNAAEYDTINPFTDYRLDVEFSDGSQKIFIPGYFAADGNSSQTSAKSGNKWRVHFCPASEGPWNYKVIFLKGKNIAIADDLTEGQKCFMDGETGSFTIGKTDKTSPDFRSKGRLQYNGTHYLKLAGSGEVFLKGGADSPENFLGYREFDGTYYGGNNKTRGGEAAPNNGLHLYEPHIRDWNEGDPQWKIGRGKGIIGALNYLSSKGMNSVYMLTLNILGDGEDVWPYTDRNERYRFDCSKLDQWDIVFSHADKLGIMLHFVLQETENECLLDCGYLDVQRKLYLRELIARFSHHLAITWNLGEEHNPVEWSPYGQTYNDTKLMADYIRATDPYDNFIVVHTHSDPAQRRKDMTAYLGFSNIEGPSIQCGNVNDVHDDAIYWLEKSQDSGHPWVVCTDEIGQHWKGALPDAVDPAHDTIRYKVLWGNLMAGGGGVEWYFGYNYPHSDLGCEDWRSRDLLWDQTKIALDFFHKYLPFTKMSNADEITKDKNDYCLAKEGEIYAIYFPEGKATDINLPGGQYSVQWFNPREGGDLVPGSVNKITGTGYASTGNPPVPNGKDWVCLIRRF
ncbi:MAG: hypothetical protein A2V64_08550 [Bacteroidetes bacterium RBG_13_43_22]|nr:MAG: hypothetical protein A2V64_08550 [Bacteroidetes bacterium RBG_13_43_22]